MSARTVLPFVALTLIVISGLLLGIAITKEDWMTEQLEIKLGSIMKLVQKLNISGLKNGMTGGIPGMGGITGGMGGMSGGIGGMTGGKGGMTKLLSGGGIEEGSMLLHLNFGLKSTCFSIKMSGMKKSAKALNVPTMKICVSNDLFTDPDYELPQMVKQVLKKEMDALNNVFVCVVIGLICVAVAFVASVLKAPCVNMKFRKPLIFVTIALCLIAAITAGAAMGVLNDNFNFEEDFKQAKNMYRQQQNPGTPGYNGQNYPEGNAGNRGYGYGGGRESGNKKEMSGHKGTGGERKRRYQPIPPDYKPKNDQTLPTVGMKSGIKNEAASFTPSIISMLSGYAAEFTEIIRNMEMKEAIGCPAVYCGITITLLVIAALLSFLEYYYVRNNNGIEYDNVALTNKI